MSLKRHCLVLTIFWIWGLNTHVQANGGNTFATTQSGATSGATQNWDDPPTWDVTAGTATRPTPNNYQDIANLLSVATSSTITVDGDFAVGTIDFNSNGSDAGSWTLAGPGQLQNVGTINSESSALEIIAADIGAGNSTVGQNLTFNLGLGAYVKVTGVISDEYGGTDILSMVNPGTLELDAANTYSGGTFLYAGTIVAGNAVSPLGTGTLHFSGGTLMAGNGVHTINLSNYNQSGGTLYLYVTGNGQAAVADKVAISNVSPATLGGALDVNLNGYVRASHGTTTFTLVSTLDGYTGTFTPDFIGLASGLTASLDYTTDDVLLDITQPSLAFSLGGLDPNQQAILGPINTQLVAGSASPSLTVLVAALAPFSTNPAAFGGALDQLSPEAFGRFTSETAFNNASFETQAMDSYLESRRAANGSFLPGNGTVDTSGLTINDPSYDPALSMVHSRLLAWNPPAPSGGMLSDMANQVLGGIDMNDPKDMKKSNSMAGPTYTDPWNFFVRGNVILAQGLSQQDVGHFDDNTESVVLGTDYRLTPNFLFGLTAGYAHTDVTLDNNGSSATVDSYSPGFYASYANKGWYANLTGDYVHNAYTHARNIAFLGQTANSAPEGNEGVANIDGGYDFHEGALTFGPLAGLQYTHLSVDGYNESGSIADLSVDDQEDDSLRSRLGGHLSYSFSHYGMIFRPHLDAAWQHEFMDQSRGITSQFNGFGGGSFSVRTDAPERDSALADIGFDADINRTVTVFTDYSVQAGQSNYFGQSVQAGVKIGF